MDDDAQAALDEDEPSYLHKVAWYLSGWSPEARMASPEFDGVFAREVRYWLTELASAKSPL